MVSLKVVDVLGKEVAVLVGGYQPSGRYVARFDASRLASGVYFARLIVETQSRGKVTQVSRMVLMR
jgi:hypothetical protein